MSWGGRSHAPPLLVHAGRPDSVRQRGRTIWCRPNRMKPRRGTSGTVVEVQTASTQTIVYAQQQWRTVSHASWSFGCDMKGVSYFYVTAKKKKKLWTSTCMPVCARYAHPATCFFADPRGYAYVLPRHAYCCCRGGLCHARAVPRRDARNISNTPAVSCTKCTSGRY